MARAIRRCALVTCPTGLNAWQRGVDVGHPTVEGEGGGGARGEGENALSAVSGGVCFVLFCAG